MHDKEIHEIPADLLLVSVGQEPDLGRIGLSNREVLTQTLTAMAESIEPDLEAVAVWLRRMS